MTKVLDAIEGYLTARAAEVPGGDLISLWTQDMETQVYVCAGQGEPVEGKRNTYSDGINEWWHVRVPKNANSEPTFHNYELPWLIRDHVEAIGCTGWDWKNKRSRWFGFDFDAITGHAEGIGVSQDTLLEVQERACQIPYVMVRYSTSGEGRHLYVLTDEEGIPTENHTVHAALARAILAEMSTLVGFNFAHAVDACGGNMWIDHRKITFQGNGLKLIKPAERPILSSDISPDWASHEAVVTRERSKVKVTGIQEADEDDFDRLTSSRRQTPLDEKHRAIIDAIHSSGGVFNWVADHHLGQTHTYCLQQLLQDEETKERLGLEGVFETVSEGTNLKEANCFVFPEPNGAFKVVRFGQRTNEKSMWQTSESGWVNATFNAPMSFAVTMEYHGGQLLANDKGYAFATVNQAILALESYGRTDTFEPIEPISVRNCELSLDKVGNIVIEVERQKSDTGAATTFWIPKGQRKWLKVLRTRGQDRGEEQNDLDKLQLDDRLRRTRNSNGSSQGYYYNSNGTDWFGVQAGEVKDIMEHIGVDKNVLGATRGSVISNVWDIVVMPFKPEYPGGRLWNRDAPQFRHKPLPPHEGTESPHPHWDMVLDHIGQSLNKSLRGADWARSGGIHSGRDYLTHWIACLLREPQEPLPYLFLFGPQNGGKSILHEAIQTLMTKGVVFADRVLRGSDPFNGELEGALVAVVEETDLSRRRSEAYNRIKEYVTSRTLSIRKMFTDASSCPNYTHWIQCANDASYCPVLPGDTRITVLYVPPVKSEIPKTQLLAKLTEEGPAFMRTLLDLRLIRAEGRLRLPVVENEYKHEVMESNRHPLETFIEGYCHAVPGAETPFVDFYAKFLESLPSDLRATYRESEIRKGCPKEYPVGLISGRGNQLFIANLSLERSTKPSKPYKKVQRYLLREDL